MEPTQAQAAALCFTILLVGGPFGTITVLWRKALYPTVESYPRENARGKVVRLKILISDISVNPGRRETCLEHIEELAKSMENVGIINPITVDKAHCLIAGLHRLEAAKRLGWTEIECTVSDLEGLEAELAEIDENFVRKDLSGTEFRELLLRRKDIYETLHPETKAGAAQAVGMNRAMGNNVAAPSAATFKPFVNDTADKLGVAPRTIREELQIAKNLTPEAKEIIGGMTTTLPKKTVLKISRLNPDQQKEVAGLLASKEIKSIKDYRPELREEAAEQDEADAVLQETPSTVPVTHTPPAGDAIRGTPLFREIVADLKNADKDFSCTPDSFIAEITAFVQNFKKELDWYNMPYYEAVYPSLSSEQMQNFRNQMNAICVAVQDLIHHVEVNVK